MTTKDNLIALINQANALEFPLSVNSVTFADPVPVADDVHDTSVTLQALPHSGYKGSVAIHYNRIGLSEITSTTGLFSETPFTIDSVVARLNQHPTTPLEVTDIQAVSIPNLNVGGVATIQLQAEAGSLGWNGTNEVTLMFGLPPNVDELFNFMNSQLPKSQS